MIDPLCTRERVEIEKRKALTRREVIDLAVAQMGLCGCGCGVKLDAIREGVIDEHVQPLGLNGPNAMPNRSLWRRPCSAAKTKGDIATIAKAKRQEKLTRPKEPSDRPIPARPDPWPKGRKLQSGVFETKRRNPQANSRG